MEYKLIKDTDYIRYDGRIIFKDDMAVLGYTNSAVTIRFRGKRLTAVFTTGWNDKVNEPGLRVYADGEPLKNIVIKSFAPDSEEARAENKDRTDKIGIYAATLETVDAYRYYETEVASFDDDGEHEVRIVKITEAAMSFVGVKKLTIDGEILKIDKKESRKKALFIGDSITCGYGVLGKPDSEYTLREEDGELCYAAVMTRKMDWNSQWVSVSGFGMFVEYTGNPENIVPKVFAYQDWFYDKDILTDYSEFVPDNIIVNLGTNDSGPMTENENIKKGYLARYESFLYTLRMAYPNANIICVLGTLAPGYYKYVDMVLKKVKNDGFERIYGLELPEHDVKNDGMASGHPSAKTHEKDADRILAFMKENSLI